MSLRGQLDVTVGDAVAFRLSVSNAGDEPVELRFRDGQAAEFVVLADDEPVWRWSDGRMFTQALWGERLASGESVTYDGVWETPEPGGYEAVGSLAATNADVEARSRFSV